MLVFASAGWAADPTINVGGAAGLPLNGSVAAGSATGNVSGNQLTITQTTDRAVIDWPSFNIDAGKAVHFAQPAGGAVLNRVSAATNASQISGALSADGMVMLMNPHGVLFNQGSSVNVGALIATTGTIDETTFTNTHARITGATGGVITNHGNISATAGANGLVALVAPSVINQGVITATSGSIALLGSSAATISLNGGLYEFAIPGGATGAEVTNAAGATLNAKNLYLGVGDAANLLTGVINLEGIQQASNAIVVNGDTVVLKSALQAAADGVSGNSNTVNVSGAGRIQDGVDIVKSGGAVNVADGTYVQPAKLLIDKSLTLSGAGQGATLIDARGVPGYGIEVTADNVTLKDFTLYGPTANIPSAYGIKVSPTGNAASARLHDFSIRNVTIRGSGKAELDLNGVVGALIDRVTADGAPVGGGAETNGAGIQITDSANVTVRNSTTRNNKWGGLALYQANKYRNQQVNNITVEANNSFTELNPVYLQDESASRDFGTLSIAGFDHAVRNGSSTNSNHQYTWLQASRQNAFDFAVNLGASASSYVQGWNGAATTQNFHVGTGSLQAGGTQAMSIGTAVGAAGTGAAVDVYAGTYTEQVALNKANMTLRGNNGATINVLEGKTGVDITANGVTVEGMQITGPNSQNFAAVNWAGLSTTGVKVAPGVSGATIRNNTIKNIRSGIQVTNAAAAITGNTIENTKGAILVRSNNVTMSGNSRGSLGNEWDIVFLDGVANGSYFVSPHSSEAQYGAGVMALSAANGDMQILDRRYGVNGLLGSTPQFGNRSHVSVSPGPTLTAADDFGLGNGLGNVRQPLATIQGGIDAVVIGGTVKVAAGTFAENVLVNSRRDLAFNDTRLQSLTLGSGAAESGIGGTVTAEGSGGITFNAPVRLLADTTLATTGADITLNGDIQNAGGVARGLRLIAGAGATRGNVFMATGGSAAAPLGYFDVSANSFSLADTLWVSAYKIDALGNVTLSNSTLRAQDSSAASSLNAGGDVTGSTISQGSVEVVSAGDIQANIAGTTVAAQAQGAMDVVVTASQTATLTADTIVATITAADVVASSQGNMNVVVAASGSASLAGDSVVANVTAPVVAVEAVNEAQISGAASQITLDAPKGSVSGSFTQVNNTGGGLVNVNGKPQANQTVSSNAENNRVIPAGGVQDSGGEGGAVQVAQSADLSRKGGSEVNLSTPEAVGDALDSGRSVELDMSPRKPGKQSNKKEEKEQGE